MATVKSSVAGRGFKGRSVKHVDLFEGVAEPADLPISVASTQPVEQEPAANIGPAGGVEEFIDAGPANVAETTAAADVPQEEVVGLPEIELDKPTRRRVKRRKAEIDTPKIVAKGHALIRGPERRG